MKPDERIRVERDGVVVVVTLANPDRRNVQDPEFWKRLAQIGADLAPDVRGVLLQSDGISFSAGLDRALFVASEGQSFLAELAGLNDDEIDCRIDDFQSAFSWWRRPELVTVAAVQGHAVGAGFQLALACDLRVVSPDARFAMRETSLGLVPDLAGTFPLVSAVGYSAALEMCLSGRWVDAQEAVRRGLAHSMVEDRHLRSHAREILESLIEPMVGAVSETKALLQGAAQRTYDAQRAAERAAQTRRLRSFVSGTAEPDKRNI